MKHVVFVFFLWITSFLQAQNIQSLFSSANSFYQEGKYDMAIDKYKEILNQGQTSSELYFNLANCYYKINKVASSIYFYEKALKFNPNNIEAKNNLVYANKLTLDRIDTLPKPFLDKFYSISKRLSVTTWAILAIVFSIFSCILFVFYYFSSNTFRKKIYFIGSVFSLLCLSITFLVANSQYNIVHKHKYAIIFGKKVSVTSEPTSQSNQIFMLHEGTKVKVLDTVDQWKEIKIADGKTGWILSKDLKQI